jgi:hypothetical protein
LPRKLLLRAIRYVADPEFPELELPELAEPELPAPPPEDDCVELVEPQAAARTAAATSIPTKPSRRFVRDLRPVSSDGVCSVASM